MNAWSFSKDMRMSVPNRGATYRSSAWLAFAAALLAAPVLRANPADQDPTFNGGAFDVAVGTISSGANAVALQKDGRVVLGGYTRLVANNIGSDWALVRRNKDGSLDTSFGGGTGQVVTPMGGIYQNGLPYGVINGLAIQSDGKILGVGMAANSTGSRTDVFLARWNSDGTLDTSFGTGGKVETFLSAKGSFAAGVVLQKDGKPVVVASNYLTSTSPPAEPVVIRYTTSGALDATFGTGGIFRLPASVPSSQRDYAMSITMQPNGRILVGTAGYQSFHPEVLRLTSDGALDPSFGTGGIAVLPYASGQQDNINVMGLVVQPDGLIDGVSAQNGGGNVFRLLRNGAIDKRFAQPTGYVLIPSNLPTALALLPTGQLLFAVSTTIGELEIYRYTSSGQKDTTFTDSSGSFGGERPSPGGGTAAFKGLQLQSDGKFVLGGVDTLGVTGKTTFLAARYEGNPVRLLPKAFAFTNVSSVAASTVQVSNVVRVVALTAGAYVPIEVAGGSYSINGDPFTKLLGYVTNGDQVMVEHTSAATSGTAVTTTLRVGGINSSASPWVVNGARVTATFTSTTK